MESPYVFIHIFFTKDVIVQYTTQAVIFSITGDGFTESYNSVCFVG